MKHTPKCDAKKKIHPCNFYIFDKDKYKEMDKNQIKYEKDQMDKIEENIEDILNEEESEEEEEFEKSDEEGQEKNEIIFPKIQKTKYVNEIKIDGSNYIKKKLMNSNII